MWNIKGDSLQNIISYGKGRISDFALSRNGQYVISAIVADSGIRVFDIKNWKSYKKIPAFKHFAEHIVLGDDDSTIYTSSNFSSRDTSYIEVKKWNFYSGKCLDSTVAKTEKYYTPKIEYAAATNELLFLFRDARLATIETQPLHFGSVLKSGSTIINIAIEKEPGKFMLIGEDGPIKELSVTDNSYRIIHQSEGKDHIAYFTPLVNSPYAVIKLSRDSKLYKFDIRSFEKEPAIKDSITIRNFVMSPDEKTVAYYTTSSRNGFYINHSDIVVKNFANDSLLFKKPILTYLLTPYGLVDKGKVLADQSKLDTISLTPLSDPSSVYYLLDTAFKNQNVSEFIPIGENLLLTPTYTGRLFLWDWKKGKLIKQIAAHPGSLIYKVAFNSDSSRFLTLADEVVKLWDAGTFTLIQSYKGHESWVSTGGFMKNGKQIYTSGADYTFRIWDIESGKEQASFMMVDTADIVTRLPNKYYAATKYGMKCLNYRINNELLPFEQFDLQYNRPHEVLRALGSNDSSLIHAYEKAYQRRLKKAGFRETDFNGDMHLPTTVIVNQDALPVVATRSTIEIEFNATDTKYKLDRYFVSVNNVPVNGINGTSLRSGAANTALLKIPVKLSSGKNKIQVSCMNEKGVESLRREVYITYRPVVTITPKIYFIGIGVSKYKDAKHDLTYADKDTRDLAKMFKQRYPGAIIDTLLNASATASRIISLKEKLKKTSIDDIVIVSVSSHGLLDKNQDYYIGTYDVNFNNPAKNGLRYEDLHQLLEDIPARKKLLLIDACNSGEVDKENSLTEIIQPSASSASAFSGKGASSDDDLETKARYKNSLEIMNELFADVSRTNGAVIISAAGGREYAFEDAKWKNGVFTYCIKKALLEKLADTNDDGISVNELRKYVSEQVYKLTDGRQHPTMRQENVEFDWHIW